MLGRHGAMAGTTRADREGALGLAAWRRGGSGVMGKNGPSRPTRPCWTATQYHLILQDVAYPASAEDTICCHCKVGALQRLWSCVTRFLFTHHKNIPAFGVLLQNHAKRLLQLDGVARAANRDLNGARAACRQTGKLHSFGAK